MSLKDTLDTAGDLIRAVVGGMAPRERVLVGFTAFVLTCFVGYFALGAMHTSKARIRANLASTSQAQARVDGLLAQYAELAGTAEILDTRLEAGRDFAPLTWIESVGNEMGIASNIRSVTERGVEETDYYIAQKIDLVVDNVDLRQTVDLLHRLEQSGQAVRIDECRVKVDRKNRSLLDLRLEIAVLRPAGGA